MTPCRPYSVLLPVGFAVPGAVAGPAVRSYRTLSPWPRTSPRTLSEDATSGRAAAVCFLWHFP